MATEHFHQSQLDLNDTENFFSAVLPKLDERARRLVVAAIAESGGRANLSYVARCASVSRPTIYSGLADLYEDEPDVKANGERRKRRMGQPDIRTQPNFISPSSAAGATDQDVVSGN